MKKVISFTLWGNAEIYLFGGLLNADIAKKEWPGWICRYYVDATEIPKLFLDELNSRDNTEIIYMNESGCQFSTLWRFYAAEDCDVMISRDADSRLNNRDKVAVDEWITSGKDYHILRDSCQHTRPMAAGMWGVRGRVLKDIRKMVDDYREFSIRNEIYDWFGVDQEFLEDIIYPLTRGNALVHDDWTTTQPIFAGEERTPMPISRLRGDGWWKQEFPEWHNGFELHKESHWFRDENCKNPECCRPCPACGEYHDNCYIGQTFFVTEDERNKYNKLKGIFG